MRDWPKRWADLSCGERYTFLRRNASRAAHCWGIDLRAPDLRDGNITLMRGVFRALVPAYLDKASGGGLVCSCVEKLRRPPFFTSYTGPEQHP